MKIKSINIILVFVIAFSFLAYLPIASAQNTQNYTVLQELPGIGDGTGGQTRGEITLAQYIPAAFRLTVGIAIALAFIFITVGGIVYATTDSFTGKQDGRNYIYNAVVGLVLVIGSYVILYTINPQILNFNINILGAPGITPATTAAVSPTPSGNCIGGGCLAFSSYPDLPAVRSAIGSGVSAAMMPRLVQLDGLLDASGVSWQITEGGYSPSVIHQSQCHNQGTCVDATPTNKAPRNLNTFVSYAQQSGLSPIFEVETDVECFNLKSTVNRDGSPRRNPDGTPFVPYTGPILVLRPDPVTGRRQITGTHFSVYNYPRTAPTTCP